MMTTRKEMAMHVLSSNYLLAAISCIGLALVSATTADGADHSSLKIITANTDFEDAAFELDNAIVDRGLKIDYRGDIGKMMERTAADFGGDRSDYKNAKFVTFCSVPLTRNMTKADHKNIGFCPYVVFLYELRSEPGKTYIGYRPPIASGSAQSVEAVSAIDKLLSDIIQQAAE